MNIESTGTPILYLGFTVLVIALLLVDFLVLNAHGAHRVRVKEAAGWSTVAGVAWFSDTRKLG